jgi:hypothetical protein
LQPGAARIVLLTSVFARPKLHLRSRSAIWKLKLAALLNVARGHEAQVSLPGHSMPGPAPTIRKTHRQQALTSAAVLPQRLGGGVAWR